MRPSRRFPNGKATRGLTVIEVVVAMALLVGVGTLLFRSFHTASLGVRSSEAAESATALLKTAVVLLSREPQPWIPNPGQTVKLTKEQIKALLAQTPEATYTNPALYEVTATRSDPTTLDLEVCVKPAGGRLCFAQKGLRVPASLMAGSGKRPSPKKLPPVPPGEGHLVLTITAPNQKTPVHVSVSDRVFKTPGIHSLTLPPGSHTIKAEPTADDRYSYSPSPETQSFTVLASQSVSRSVEYRCITGAAQVSVYYPEGYTPTSGTVTLSPVGKDVSNGGLVPYLSPGSYSLSAKKIQYGNYTYEAKVSPPSFEVFPCQTAQASANYVAADGALVVEVGPDLADLRGRDLVKVDGPEGPYWAKLGRKTFRYLDPGIYDLTPESPLVEGVRYRASGPRSVQVEPGKTSTASFTYAPVSGRIRVEATAPNGLTPRFTLTGPGGYSASGSGSAKNFDDLTPGDYAVSFEVLEGGNYTYGVPGSPLGVSLAAGERKTVKGNYVPITGALTVSVKGLPASDLYTYVSVNGTPLKSNPYTFIRLAPGTYRVQAQSFSYRGYTYAPNPPTQDVSVEAGKTTTATVTYTRQEGTVTVEVKGLPSGVAADATLTLPDGTTRSITTSQTLTGMPTGTYRLTAREISAGGITYKPSIAPSAEQTLSHGGNITFTLTYTPITGNLYVQIRGLPDGVAGEVTVTGPNGYARAVSGSTLLTGLTPGTYRLSPKRVQTVENTPYGKLTYTWIASPGQVNVEAGKTKTATITYDRQAGNLAVSWNAPSWIDWTNWLSLGAKLEITGPGGFNRVLYVRGQGSQTFSGIPTGTYTLTPYDYTVSGITYGATSTQAVVEDGQTTSVSIRWVPKTGRIEVAVKGVPQGVVPTVKLISNGRLIRTAQGTQVVFNDLAPGHYQVEGESFYQAGFRYDAKPIQVDVYAGKTSRVTITYQEQAGYLRISTKGLPSGVSGKATLSPGRTLDLPGTYKVATGSYTLTVQDVTDTRTGIVYRGILKFGSKSGKTISFAVSAGATLDILAEYSAQASTLTLNVSGLPSGASATYTVTGNGRSYSRNGGNGTYPFYLPYGTYTVTATEVLYGNYRYQASISPNPVSLGSTGSTVQVAYQPVSGALVVTLQGVPSTCTVTISLKGPTNRSQGQTGSGTLTFVDLPPGRYTVSVTKCPDATPDSSSKTTSVSAGSAASITFTYTKLAKLTVYVRGLPSGLSFRIPISGPTPITVTAPTQTAYVLLGQYSYAAQEFSTQGNISGVVYYWRTPARTFTVGGDTTLYIDFTGTGSIVLDIISPVGADVSVAGRRYTSPGRYIINNLAPGNYTLTANSVTANGITYQPNPASTTLSVSAGNYAQAQVVYSTDWARLIINITQSRDTSTWYSVPGFLVQGGYWQWWGFVTVWQKTFPAPGIASRTAQYTEVVKAGLTYRTDVGSGHVYKVGEGYHGDTRYEDYWVLYYSGLPKTPNPGEQMTVNVRWVAKRCEWIRWGKWAWQVEKKCYEPYDGPK